MDAKVAPFRDIQRRWLQDALAAAERDDYREAIHCGYWAGVTRLEDAGSARNAIVPAPRENRCASSIRNPRNRECCAN